MPSEAEQKKALPTGRLGSALSTSPSKFDRHLAFDPICRGFDVEGVAHPQYGEDIDLAEDLLVNVGWPLRNHGDTDASHAALFDQAAHGAQADFLASILCQLRSERVGLVDEEVKRRPIDPK